MLCRLARAALALALVAPFARPAAAAVITLVGGANDILHVEVSNFTGNVEKNENPNPVPGTKTVAVTSGDDRSSLTANLTNSAFTISFDQVANFSRVLGQAHLFFTVSEDVNFSIAGSFGVDGAAFNQQLLASLTEQNSGEPATKTLYNSMQSGNHNSATTLTLPGVEGDTLLHPGITYAFTAGAGFEAPTDPNGAGSVTLAFAPVGGGGTNPVPLPPAAFAGLAWAAGFAGWRKWRGK